MIDIKHIQMPKYAMKMTKKEIYVHGYDAGYVQARFELEEKWAEKNQVPTFRFLDDNQEAANKVEPQAQHTSSIAGRGGPVKSGSKLEQPKLPPRKSLKMSKVDAAMLLMSHSRKGGR